VAGNKKGKSTIENSDINIENESTASNETELLEKEFEKELEKETIKPKTKEVDFNDVGNTDGEKVQINFDNQEDIEDFTAKQSKKSSSSPESKLYDDDTSAEELRERIKQEEQKSKEFKAKDFEEIARFIIFLIDASLSSLLRWWAKDNSDSSYQLGADKKNQLISQLTLILVKYQAKFNIEWMFLITVLVLYIPPFMRAHEHRKDTLAIPVNPIPQQKPVEKKPEKKPTNVMKMDIVSSPVFQAPITKEPEPVIEEKKEEILEPVVEDASNENPEVLTPPRKKKRRKGAPNKN